MKTISWQHILHPAIGIQLNLSVSLHNQGVLEQEQIILAPLDGKQLFLPTSQSRSALDRRKSPKGNEVCKDSV